MFVNYLHGIVSLKFVISHYLKLKVTYKMIFTIQECAEAASLFCKNNVCARATSRSFSGLHSDKPVHRKYILALMEKFKKTGSVRIGNINLSELWLMKLPLYSKLFLQSCYSVV